MKILVSTTETQGQRPSDFCFVPADEMVAFGWECDRDHEVGPDGGCGCRRALVGFECRKATTTFKVMDRPITSAEFIRLYLAALKEGGWMHKANAATVAAFSADAEEMLRIARQFPVGAVLEKRGDTFQMRRG